MCSIAALLSNTTRSVTHEIKNGFVSVPTGCYIQLEKQAAKYILENIRASYGNTACVRMPMQTLIETEPFRWHHVSEHLRIEGFIKAKFQQFLVFLLQTLQILIILPQRLGCKPLLTKCRRRNCGVQ